MSVTLFITLLTIFSTITSICTQGCKKILDELNVAYASNIVAFIIACVVGIGGTAIYYILCSVEFNIINVVCMILMGLATSFGAMIGYDKVVQAIDQLRVIKFK